MEVIYTDKKYNLSDEETKKFGFLNEINDEFKSVKLILYEDEFKQLLNDTFIMDFSDEKKVYHQFHVLSYFNSVKLEMFLKKIYKF